MIPLVVWVGPSFVAVEVSSDLGSRASVPPHGPAKTAACQRPDAGVPSRVPLTRIWFEVPAGASIEKLNEPSITATSGETSSVVNPQEVTDPG